MDDARFAAAVAEWHDFYSLAGGAAATLIGLVFVALSVNPGVMADDGATGLREWAGQTFNNFLAVLIVALVCLIPAIDRTSLGLALIGLGAPNLLRAARRLGDARADPGWRTEHTLWRFITPTAAHATFLAVAIDVLRGGAGSLAWLVLAVFLLVSSAAGSSWELLKEMGGRHRNDLAGQHE